MNKELQYFGLFNSHNYFPKPNKYVMEINSEEKIVKSTLEAIIIHFTNSIDSLNYNDLNNFFITYRSFSNTTKLLDILLYRFKWSIKSSLELQFGNNIMNDNDLIKIYNVIIIRTFIILRHWINNYIIEDFLFNDDVLNYFTTFVQNEIYKDLISKYLDKENSNNMKLIVNCITNLKKIWINKYNQCFDYPHYHINETSNEYFLKYNIIINNKKAKKHLSSFALNYSTDPLVRNKSFLNIVGNEINLTKSKNSILYPNNSMLVNQNNTIQHHNTTFSRISNKSHLSNDSNNKNKLNFVQSLNVPETSKIDVILPSTPTKNLEFAVNFNDLLDNGIGVRDSIYGLLNRWNGTEVTNANTVENSTDVADNYDSIKQNDNISETIKVQEENSNIIGDISDETADNNLHATTNSVSKFVRYVFSIGKMNNESDDIEDDFELDDNHKFDILSARSIDEVQFIVNNELLDPNAVLNTSTTSDDSNYNKMDNLNLYSKVLQITNTLSPSKLNNINLSHASPNKDNFTTSPFLRSIEKTKTQINNRDWFKENKSNELVFSSERKSVEIKDIHELELENDIESEVVSVSPTKSKHRSSHNDKQLPRIGLPNDMESMKESNNDIVNHIATEDNNKDDRSSRILNGDLRVSTHTMPKRVVSVSNNTPQRILSFTTDSQSPSIKNYQSVYTNLKQELPKARNSGRISVSMNNRHTSLNSNTEKAKYPGIRISSINEARESKEAIEDPKESFAEAETSESSLFKESLEDIVIETASINLNSGVSRNVSLLEKQNLQVDDVFKQQEDQLKELSLKLSNSNLKRKSHSNGDLNIFDTDHIVTTKNTKDIEEISVNSSVDTDMLFYDIDDNSDQPDVPKRFTVGLNLDREIEEEVILKSKDNKKTDLRELFKNQMNDNSSSLSFMIYGENDVESFEELDVHRLDVNPHSFIKEESPENKNDLEENEEQEEIEYQEGDNPLEIAMRKLEGTFDDSDKLSDFSSRSTKIEDIVPSTKTEDIVPSTKTIVKSQTMHNLSSNLKKTTTLIQNRRQTLLSTTNLSSIMDNEFSAKKGGSNYTSPKKLTLDTNSVYYNEQEQPQFNPNDYINNLLLNYNIKDKTLLIQNNKEHIPFILMYSSREIAEQLTLIERDVLNEVDWKSLLQLEMNENLDSYTSWLEVLINQDSLSGVDLGIARFNLTVDWIISEIVLTKDIKLKRNALQKFIHVAEHCIELQNFNTSMQIVLALSSTEVQFFKDSWRLVEPGDMLSWAEMNNLFSSDHDDYKLLRELMDDMDPIKGCLPFLVLYLSDLKNLHNMSTFFHSNHDIINYKKFDSLSNIVKNFIQRVNWGIEFYDLTLNQQLLSKCLYISSLHQWEITELLKSD